MPMGGNFGDVDNDGYPGHLSGTGNPSYGSLLPNVLLRNKEGKYFVDVTTSSGTGELHKGHGVAMADLDNDGDVDILTSIGGAVPGDRHAFRLFENPGNANDWIGLRLVGVKTNRSAIGARIKVTVKNEGKGTRRDLSHRRQPKLFRRIAVAAAHRLGQVCANREDGNTLAGKSGAADIFRRG